MVDEKKSLQDKAIDRTIADIAGGATKVLKAFYKIVDYSGGIGRKIYNRKGAASAISALIGGGEGGILYSWIIEKLLYEPYDEPTLPIGKLGAVVFGGLRFGHTVYEANKILIKEETSTDTK